MRRPRILVAHASKHGSTAEVAETVASALRDRGVDADLSAAGDVDSVEPYTAVVLGAALYMGRVHADARRFLRRFRGELADRELAIFAMGPREDNEEELESSRRQLERALETVPEVVPVTTAVFGGVLDPSQHRFPFNRMAPSDARDWDAIHAWADEVAGLLGADRPAALPAAGSL